MANEQIIQKLITELSWKINNSVQKKYDKANQDSAKLAERINKKSNDKINSDHKKSVDKKAKEEAKSAEKYKKLIERAAEYELTIRAKLASKRNADYEKDYKALVTSEAKKEQIRERVLQAEQRIRARMEQIKQRQADRDLLTSQRNAERQQKITERLIAAEARMREKAAREQEKRQADFDRRRMQSRERDFERRLQDIQNRNNARNQNSRDNITNGHVIQGAGRSIKSVGSAGMTLFGGLIGASTQTAGDIELLLNKTQAFGEFKDSERGSLDGLAKSISLTSAFNKKEILEGMIELGKAGFKGEKLKIATKAMPNFATSSDVRFDQASKLATDMMFTFGYEAKDLVKITDILTTAMIKSKIDFADLNYALQYSAGTAKAGGAGLAQLSGLIAVLGQTGIKGSKSGTALRSMYTNLATGQQEILGNKNLRIRQKATAKSLGLNVFDKHDNIDLSKVLIELGGKLNKMKTGQKLSVLKDLFGKPAQSQAQLVIEAFTDPKKRKDAFDTYNQVNFGHKGMASNTTKKINKGYNFQQKQLENATINVQEAIGKNFLPAFTDGLNIVSKFFNRISEGYPTLTKLVAIFSAIGFAVSTLAVMFGGLLIFAGAVTVAMGVLEVSLGGIAMYFLAIPLAIMAVIGTLIYLGYQIYQFCTTGKTNLGGFANWVNKTFNDLFGLSIPALFDNLVRAFNAMSEAIIPIFSSMIESLKSIWNGWANSVTFDWLADKMAGAMVQSTMNPTGYPLGGVNNRTVSQTNSNQIIIHQNGSNSNPHKTANVVGGAVDIFNKKSLSQIARTYSPGMGANK